MSEPRNDPERTQSAGTEALTEAAYQKKRRNRLIAALAGIAVLLALAVILMILPGGSVEEEPFQTAQEMLKIYGYDGSMGFGTADSMLRELGNDHIPGVSHWWQGMNSLKGVPLKLQVEDPSLESGKIVFHCRVNHGQFDGDYRSDKYKVNPEDLTGSPELYRLGQEFTIDNGEKIFWYAGGKQIEDMKSAGRCFVDIIVKAEDHIIGYAVLEIGGDEDMVIFWPWVIKSQYYPKADGQFQDVTEEYIQEKIAECKK